MISFSPWSYILFTVWGVVLALVADGWQLFALVTLEVVFGLLVSRKGLRPVRRLRFWVFITAAVALGPLLTREAGSTGEGITSARMGLSNSVSAGLVLGLGMAARALALTLSFSLGLSALSLSDVMVVFDRVGLRGLGFALGVAMNLFGTLREMASVTFQTIKLRGGLRRPVVGLRLFLVTLLSNTIRYGDQVVNAASVRAFDPNSKRYSPLHQEGLHRRADMGLLVALALCSGILLFVVR